MNMRKRIASIKHVIYRYADYIAFLLCMAGCVCYGLSIGQTMSVDVMNYHLYNAYAFVEGRFYTDVIPAGIHTFLNPLPDIPYYLLIRWLNNWPHLVAGILAALSGGLLFVFYKICRLIFSRKNYIWVIFAVLIVVGGFMFRSQIASPNNDVLLNLFAALSVYWGLLFLLFRPRCTKLLFWAAFVAGALAGAKHSLFPVLTALFAVLCVNGHRLQKPVAKGVLFAGAALGGFLLTDGYFMWRLWENYNNPVFPFYNEIFQSPFFALENLKDARFYPQTWIQWLFFPFLRFMNKGDYVISEVLFDYRMSVGFVSFLVLGGILFWKRQEQNIHQRLENRKMLILWVLTGVMYVFWLAFFGGILRYLIILEMLNGLLIVCCLKKLGLRKILNICLVCGLFVFFLKTTYSGVWGEKHVPFTKQAIAIFPSVPKIEKNALIIFWGSPMSFLAPFFPEASVFVGGIKYPTYGGYHLSLRQQARKLNLLPDLYFRHNFDEKIKETIACHEGPIYMISVYWELMLEPRTLAPYGVESAGEPCQNFNSNANVYFFPNAGWSLCKLKKINPPNNCPIKNKTRA